MIWRRVWTETSIGAIIMGFCFSFGVVLFAGLIALIINLWNVISSW